jgi:Carboxypeptidase regulatory-like domain
MSARVAGVVIAVLLAGGVLGWLMFREPDAPRPPARGAPEPSIGGGERPVAPPAPALATRPGTPRIEARPFEEGEEPPQRMAAPVTGQLTVTVVDEQGRPITGAGVAPCAMDDDYVAGWTTQPVFTGADGRADVGIADATTHVLVAAKGWPPAAARIETRDRLQVVLGGEVTLRGRVVVDGAPPANPLVLTARGYQDPTDAWPHHPRHVLRRMGFADMRIPVETDARGEFAARGFAPGATAMIEIPEGYRFADASPPGMRELAAICNGAPVLVELASLKGIRGRVVSRSATGQIREIEIRYTLARPGTAPLTGSVRTLMEKPFAIYFETFLDGIDLEIRSSRGARLGRKEVAERITGSKDLGDIELDDALPWVKFRVTDAAGTPIEGARVHAEGFVSSGTDALGATGAAMPSGTRFVIAGAPGFKVARFPLPEKPPEVVELRLARSVTLIVRVRHEDPAVDTSTLRVVVAFDVDESVLPSTASPEFNDVRGAVPSGGGGSGKRQTRTYAVLPREDVSVSGFDAGDVVEVRVEDRYAHALLKESITIAQADTHPIEMIVRTLPHTITGTILDDRGGPLAGAQVGILGFWKTPWSPRTDASGRFEIPGVYAADVSVEATASGYVGKKILVENRGEPITIQLEKARSLAVTLTGGPAGRFQGIVTFDIGGESVGGSPRGERLWWFEAIPRRAGTLRVTHPGGQPVATAIGAEETSVSVPIPD